MARMDDTATQAANIRFIRKAMKTKLLARERELDLAKRWRESGDQAALDELIGAYSRMVVSAALKFRHYGLPVGDLIQEGHIGLMQAAARFEPSRDVRFATYAQWWIRAAIQDFVLRNWSIVRTGTTAAHKSLFFNLRRVRARLGDRNGEPMTDDTRAKVAQELGVTIGDVIEMEGRMSGGDRSLDAPVAGDDGSARSWGESLADERADPEADAMSWHDRDARARLLREAMGDLSPRERAVIAARRLADEDESVTLETLGTRLGVSKERVRQIEARALGKLKVALEKRVANPADLYAA
ncbi:MAG: RNA polymerase factor sigma-32 [Tagaea sp. CACIAM 22H2]|nr:RNA polymerase factor sigma-32 [Tagaea sp. CACIAM 22H2]